MSEIQFFGLQGQTMRHTEKLCIKQQFRLWDIYQKVLKYKVNFGAV